MENEKSCTNCKYYVQYYIKNRLKFSKISHGHCSKNIRKKLVLCKFWEDIETKKEYRKKKIKEMLSDMTESLNQIALVLKDDEET